VSAVRASGTAAAERLRRLTFLMWVAVAAATLTLALKTAAWLLTGSVGLLSDAAESVVNLAAAGFGLVALRWASRPADEGHAYGHDKANYLSAGFEGGLILIAAATILYSAVGRLIDPVELESVGIGLAVSGAASAINLAVGSMLLREGRRHKSLILEADGRHLITDVWTSLGVIVAVALVAITGWERLDPIIACLVALNILWIGVQLVRESAGGLMDRALTIQELETVESILDRFRSSEVSFHALRTRRSGPRAFISLHILVPGAWSVQRGHDLAEKVESALREDFEQATIFTHLEPLEDPLSFVDTALDREGGGEPSTRPPRADRRR
jgi:cation diffusion facilitator family transporter